MSTLIDTYRTYLDQTGSEVAAAILAIGAAVPPINAVSSARESSSDGPYTIPQVAKQLRTSQDTVRGWIKSGQLKAANLATGPRPRYVVTRDDLAAFLKSRQPTAAPEKRRKRIRESSDRY